MSTPLPSPHPLFGRKPGRWERFKCWLASEEPYWPTDEDIAVFKAERAARPRDWPASWVMGATDPAEARRRVKHIVDAHRRMVLAKERAQLWDAL